ncbi:hypothetical protein [Allosphingosinicella vermicomposti]|uniref:hypothetical protein n=1 Tax=Allosphingosinicella vermicomposti TaxID=614671 RepID=UPI00131A57B2|nr:hypothetical protein [Allosphingosinicella vermicomposti]
MPDQPETRWTVSENLTPEDIVEARRVVEELAKLLGRRTAQFCVERGIHFDMDDPQVAREVMMAAFDGLFRLQPRPRTAAKRIKRRAEAPQCD